MSAFEDLQYAEVEAPAVLALQVQRRSTMDPASISRSIGDGFSQLQRVLTEQTLTPAGPPRTVYTSHAKEEIGFSVAIPILAAPASIPADSGVTVGTLEGGRTMRFTHRGPYPNLKTTYGRITEFLKEKGLMETEADWAKYMPMWEEYLNDPHMTPEAELLTHIYLPLSQ